MDVWLLGVLLLGLLRRCAGAALRRLARAHALLLLRRAVCFGADAAATGTGCTSNKPTKKAISFQLIWCLKQRADLCEQASAGLCPIYLFVSRCLEDHCVDVEAIA
jgi:hypothetical protein